jgi:hypothetical protein
MKRFLCLAIVVFSSPAFASNSASPEIWDCTVTTSGPNPVTTIERLTLSGKTVRETDKLIPWGFLPPQYTVTQNDNIALIAIDNLIGKDDSGIYIVSSDTLMIDKTRQTIREFSMQSTDNVASVSAGDCLPP